MFESIIRNLEEVIEYKKDLLKYEILPIKKTRDIKNARKFIKVIKSAIKILEKEVKE